MLLDKLSQTQISQHEALANLHHAVQVCNSSIVIKETSPQKNITQRTKSNLKGDSDSIKAPSMNSNNIFLTNNSNENNNNY